jgi:xanthine/CO dehydrogenase XdhC/CoxF family maturation factor
MRAEFDTIKEWLWGSRTFAAATLVECSRPGVAPLGTPLVVGGARQSVRPPIVRRRDRLRRYRRGLLGSRNRRIMPAVFDIVGRTAAEIALSILAELLAVRNERTAQSLAELSGSIHGVTW